MLGYGEWLSLNILLPLMYTLIDLILIGVVAMFTIIITEHLKELIHERS